MTEPVPASAGGTNKGGARVIGGEVNFSGPGPQVMAASSLQGDEVLGSAGESLGYIHDIMLDVPSGRIAYAVLSFGGVLGIGEKLFAIPWNALTLDADHGCFLLDISKEKFRDAPGFDKDHWPSMAEAEWGADVHAFYQRRPYWE